MTIPSIILSEIYDLLCSYNECPKISKETFVGWYAKGHIYTISIQLRTLVFTCVKPFSCSVIQDDLELSNNNTELMPQSQLDELNEKLSLFSSRFYRVKVFW